MSVSPPSLKHLPSDYSTQKSLQAKDRKVKADLLKHSDYEYVRKLGGGAQVDVYLIKRYDEYFAAKAYSYTFKGGDIEVGKRDEDFLDLHCICRFKHPFIVSKRDFIVGEHYLFVVMDYAECNLEQYMRHITEGIEIEGQDIPYLNFESKCTIIHQIGTALGFLSKLGYVHNDVKPVNVLIVRGRPVLTDFGLTRLKEERNYTTQTYYYRAPEQLLIGKGLVDRLYRDVYPTKDVNRWKLDFSRGELWSFGILCLCVIYCVPNLTHGRDERKLSTVMEKIYCKDSYVTLMRLMLENIQKGKQNPIYSAIIAAYGEPPSVEEDNDTYAAGDLLQHVCDTLLQINQDERVASLDEFFASPIFAEYNDGLSPGKAKPFNPNVTSPKEYTTNDINHVIHLMFKQSNSVCPQTFCALEAVDLFVQRLPVYATSIHDLYLFGATCIKMIDMIHNLGYYDSADCAKMCNQWCASKYGAGDVNELILRMLRMEGGTPVIPSTYIMAPCAEVALDVCKYMQDYKTYITLGQKGMINASLEHMHKRTPKRESCGSITVLPFS